MSLRKSKNLPNLPSPASRTGEIKREVIVTCSGHKIITYTFIRQSCVSYNSQHALQHK